MANSSSEKRPFISIYWSCCHLYSRVPRNKEGTAYEGYCPKCRRHARARIGEGGTTQRIFIAY